jgi:hypothetical protein
MTHAWKVSIALVLATGWIATLAVAPAAAAGRWKKENGKCVWDAKDSGPDQCQPPAGRYKKQGDNCVWDAHDDGPDQCKPVKGRFKLNNGKCEWSNEDSGPDQCRPKPQPR